MPRAKTRPPILFALAVLAAASAVGPARAACPHDPDCLDNPFGAGSPYNPDGVNNPYGRYGSPYSNESARSPYATNPPALYDEDGDYRGRLSSNPYLPDSTSNPYGRYGSPFSPESVNNPFGAGIGASKLYVVPGD